MEDFLRLLFNVAAYQLAGVVLFLPLELVMPMARMSLADRAKGLLYLLAAAPVVALVGTVMAWVKADLNIPTLVTFRHNLWSPVAAALATAMWADFQFYVVHRLEHRFFWRFHAVHHSIRNMSAANSYHHWTEPLMKLTVAIPLLFTDVQIAPALGLVILLLRVQQLYVHSCCKPHFGPLRWLLIDNRYHRIHHSIDPAHHHKNFGALFPWWDWLFGTVYMPRSNEWPDVGLVHIDEPKSLAEWESLPRRLRIGGSSGTPSSRKIQGGQV